MNMRNMLTADDVAAVMRVSRRTAYTYMRQMPHTESPLRVTEEALQAFIDGRTVAPREKPGTKAKAPVIRIDRRRRAAPDDWHIPRRREAACT